MSPSAGSRGATGRRRSRWSPTWPTTWAGSRRSSPRTRRPSACGRRPDGRPRHQARRRRRPPARRLAPAPAAAAALHGPPRRCRASASTTSILVRPPFDVLAHCETRTLTQPPVRDPPPVRLQPPFGGGGGPMASYGEPGHRRPAADRVRRAAAPGAEPERGLPTSPVVAHPRHRVRRPPVVRRGARRRDPWAKLGRHASATTGSPATPRSTGTWRAPSTASIDRIAGHGTFIAGLVHQACPDADDPVLARDRPAKDRSSSPSGSPRSPRSPSSPGVDREGETGGHPIDVLSLSMGYYHENDVRRRCSTRSCRRCSPSSAARGRRGRVLGRQRRHRSARATRRRSHPWSEDEDGHDGSGVQPRGQLPIVSVGALNPNRDRRPVQQRGRVGRATSPGCGGDEHHADLPGRTAAGRRARWPRAGPREHRPRRLPGRFRGLERDVVRGPGCGRHGSGAVPPDRVVMSTRAKGPPP